MVGKVYDSRNIFETKGISCCTYHLIRGGEVVYVGQSTNIQSRLKSHVSGPMDFDSFTLFECSESELSNNEAEDIVTYNPEHNSLLPVNDKYLSVSAYTKEVSEVVREFADSLEPSLVRFGGRDNTLQRVYIEKPNVEDLIEFLKQKL